jgi:alcohol dehydrogenase
MYNRAADAGASGSALGVVSGLAHALDTRYPECSHGAAYSIFTAPGMRFNREHNLAGQARLAALMGVQEPGMGQREGAERAADAVADTFRSLGMPARLRDVGVPQEGITLIAEDAVADFFLSRNVRPVKAASELVELLQGIW